MENKDLLAINWYPSVCLGMVLKTRKNIQHISWLMALPNHRQTWITSTVHVWKWGFLIYTTYQSSAGKVEKKYWFLIWCFYIHSDCILGDYLFLCGYKKDSHLVLQLLMGVYCVWLWWIRAARFTSLPLQSVWHSQWPLTNENALLFSLHCPFIMHRQAAERWLDTSEDEASKTESRKQNIVSGYSDAAVIKAAFLI